MNDRSKKSAKFEFITISDGESLKDPTRQQQARTHAIKNSLQRKRRQLESYCQNFVDQTPALITKRKKSAEEQDEARKRLHKRSATLCIQSFDPFETLAVNADRLTKLLRHGSAQHAGEPVFSVNDATEHQGLRSVFTAGYQDPALASALCLTLVFASNGHVMDEECVLYNTKTIKYLNARLSNPDEAASNVTLGAVLLLVGVEARLGQRDTAQIHLEGTQRLLQLCGSRKVQLTHAIRRAIFWQDLFCCVLSGTKRVFDHTIFPELHWHRDPFQPHLYTVPNGFASRTDVFGYEFLDLVGDVCALQYTRECGTDYPVNPVEVEKVDNQQAWIESRLQMLEAQTTQPLLLCAIPAVYLCAYACFADVWASNLLPSRLSAKLLGLLQRYDARETWEDHADLLLWLLNIGIVFSTESNVRLGFISLWHGSQREHLEPLSACWNAVESHLKNFIYSDRVHGPKCKALWDRLQAD